MALYNVPPAESEPVATNHINGTHDEILARFCVSELCKGWPVYRDASEWQNYRNLFTKEGAYVWTSEYYSSCDPSCLRCIQYHVRRNMFLHFGLMLIPLRQKSLIINSDSVVIVLSIHNARKVIM